jgi:hypothetical protein
LKKTVFHPEAGYCGTLDYLLTYDEGPRHIRSNASKGTRRYQLKDPDSAQRRTAVLDVKSGASGMQESGVQQLHLLKAAAEANFDIVIDDCLHWNPTEWRTTPGFNLENATAHPEGVNAMLSLQAAKNRLGKIDDKPYRKTVAGWLLGDDPYGFKFESLTVRQAVEAYEEGLAESVGLAAANAELAAEAMLAKYFRSMIKSK